MTLSRFILTLSFISLLYSCKVTKVSKNESAKKTIEQTIVKMDSVQIVLDTLVVSEIDTIKPIFSKKDTLEIIGVGDIMMGTNFPDASYLPPNGGRDLLNDVDSILRSADLTFGNLEGVILDEGGTQKNCNNPKLCYLFRSPESYVSNLKKAGFDVLSVANNHAGDFGDSGRSNTKRMLDSLDFAYAGFLDKPLTTFIIDNVKYGFAAFSPNTGTVSINDIPGAIKIIQALDSMSDVVIVSFHGGAEGKNFQHVTRQKELFYGENRGNVYEFAHTLIDHGADIIFGHGPHVTRAIEVYKDRFIAYSLGNFCTYARFNLSGPNGIAPIIKVFVTKEGKFIKGQIYPIVQIDGGIPKIDIDGRVIKELIELTKEDFPEVKISIDESGLISYIGRNIEK